MDQLADVQDGRKVAETGGSPEGEKHPEVPGEGGTDDGQVTRSVAEIEAGARASHALEAARQHMAAGAHEEAEAELREALSAAKSSGDPLLVGEVLRLLLRCAFYRNDLETALAFGLEALQSARGSGNEEVEVLAQNDLGLVHGRIGSYSEALDHLLAGLRLQEERGMEPNPSLINNIGNVYFALANYREALTFYRSALSLFRDRASLREVGIALGNVGRSHARLGEWAEALAAFRQCVQDLESHGDHLYLAPALARLGGASAEMGDDQSARRAFERALAIIEETSPRGFADEVLLAAGRYHLGRNDGDAAVEVLRRALAAVPRDEVSPRTAELHHDLAQAYEQCGDAWEALRHYKEHQRIQQAVSDATIAVRVRGLLLEFDVERARQQEEITRLKHVELARSHRELEVLHQKLQTTLEELNTSYWHIRKIQEVLPICLQCNQVKTGESTWQDVVDYLQEHTLFLSHGYCPTCVEQVLERYGLND